MNTRASKQYAAKKAIVAIYGENGLKDFVDYADDFIVDITDDEDDCYETDLQIFKKLFNSDDKDLRKALWNALIPYSFNVKHLEHSIDFTDEELAFLTDYHKHCINRRSVYSENPNRSFFTERLKICPAKRDDEELYFKHLKNDGDFTKYTSKKLTRDNLYLFHITHPLIFSVFEKGSGNMVGIVGLHHYDSRRRKALAQWYIFKPYRNRGYATEAFTGLAKRAFEGKVAELRETSWNYKYKRHFIKLDFIRAEIRKSNIPSQRTAERCGFEMNHIDRNFFFVEDRYLEDGTIYELTPESLNERNKNETEN